MAVRVAVLMLALAAAANAHKCGLTDPEIAAEAAKPVPEVAQTYESEGIRRLLQADASAAGARELQTTRYGNTFPWVPLARLEEQGLTRPIRIKFVWDVLNSGDFLGGQRKQCTCSQAGPAATPCPSPGSSVQVSPASGEGFVPAQCTSSMVVSRAPGGNTRRVILERRTNDAAARWSRTLKIRPIADPYVTVGASVADSFGLNRTVQSNGAREYRVYDTDLVVIMTARPSPNRPVAGSATCKQKDQYGRCTVGHFNWVPELFNVAKSNDPAVVGSELHTALHEMAHLFGAVMPGNSAGDTVFINNATGAKVTPLGTVVYKARDPAYGKPMTWVRTPRVVAVARRYIECENITGFPLEDVPLGAGAHWDARYAGAEFMSYGTYTSATYISDLTLAFLEDTGQYIANYSLAGRFTPDNPDELTISDESGTAELDANGTAVAGSALPNPAGVADYSPPPAPSPGALLWGRKAGCPWFFGHPRRDWPEEYICKKHATYGCTPDNRLSAVCTVRNQWTGRSGCASQGDYPSNAACGLTFDTSTRGLPRALQFYETNEEAVEATGDPDARKEFTGGNYDAMDFLPLMVGYWSCQDVEPLKASAVNGSEPDPVDSEKGSLSSLTSVMGNPWDMSKRGGQARCKDCRCFESSLVEMTRNIPGGSNLPRYGLCYRFNCYRPDYLQIAVRSQVWTSTLLFYGCPPEGGRLWIPGFYGAVTCPAAETFCSREMVTGVKYTEQNVLYEVVFWGTAVSIVGLLALLCIVPCLRRRLVACCKRCNGVMHFDDEVVALGLKPAAALTPGGGDPGALETLSKKLPSGSGNGEVSSDNPLGSARPGYEAGGAAAPSDVSPAPGVLGGLKGESQGSCLDRSAKTFLLVINGLGACMAVAMIGLAAYGLATMNALAFGVPMIVIGCLVLFVSFVGLVSSCRARIGQEPPSCWILTYFFAVLLMFLLLLYGGVYVLTYDGWHAYVASRWDEISAVLPASLRPGATRAEQIDNALSVLVKYFWAVGAIAITTILLYLGALYAAVRLIRVRTLVAMTVTIASHVFLAFGALMIVVGGFIGAKATMLSPQLASLVGLVCGVGVFSIVMAALGEAGMFKRSETLLIAFIGVTLGFAGLLTAAAVTFVGQRDALGAWLQGVPDDDVAALTSSLNLSLTKGEVLQKMRDNLMQLALACGVMVGLLIILVSDAVIVILELQRLREAAAVLHDYPAKPAGFLKRQREKLSQRLGRGGGGGKQAAGGGRDVEAGHHRQQQGARMGGGPVLGAAPPMMAVVAAGHPAAYASDAASVAVASSAGGEGKRAKKEKKERKEKGEKKEKKEKKAKHDR